jgi:hypothetical protein
MDNRPANQRHAARWPNSTRKMPIVRVIPAKAKIHKSDDEIGFPLSRE